MAEPSPRRHDLAWVDAAALDRLAVHAADRPVLDDWLQQARPLVVGRREPGDARLRLGFTVTGTGARWRVGVLAPPDTLIRHAPPPPLGALAASAPARWQAPLAHLATAMGAIGQTVRGYGSLVNQHLSGAPCLRPDSDVDVLVDCTDRARALRALAVLGRHGDGTPRIDGELRLAGWAVAWRELAAALEADRSVLAKSDTAIRLMTAAEFLDAVHPGHDDADHHRRRAA
ncbi:malonate decarboxylase holo-[acyl-carrier-protein] synthase [Nitrogeniibacter mangrovi]|uniref:Malonate decarboxylase holo-[acyl-carrier-protein] synthase n=1 Tax=Nitrogeniibacter mangrovi TaxID=2016596 RepID=A0A6C1B9P2_9RHOO|nr:malonate decarboxylase holo-[acyl-carrier-protein] synthase [Nitrogeniibacter mangrovi]QID19565.1 malonate decarboxylase holo-[acyl-carrier-protein] synthase [Nitrogeniibacter mangrovi]